MRQQQPQRSKGMTDADRTRLAAAMTVDNYRRMIENGEKLTPEQEANYKAAQTKVADLVAKADAEREASQA